MAVHHPEVGEFGNYLGQIGRAVDDLLASDMTDALASDINWQGELSGPLPAEGLGAASTIEEYLQLILPHGNRLTSPSSWGWITTGPTTLPTVVAAGAMLVMWPPRSRRRPSPSIRPGRSLPASP